MSTCTKCTCISIIQELFTVSIFFSGIEKLYSVICLDIQNNLIEDVSQLLLCTKQFLLYLHFLFQVLLAVTIPMLFITIFTIVS